ncbi:MAG: aminotransferase class I/II-fold pyridoxal phosphate-dependent enzyme [Deltaproteobacteria bacterium]|nr:aminotransferase class I/II-fold pyridoxal phosphate-dependent enzyme [Deltaproteobacteria bacterium]
MVDLAARVAAALSWRERAGLVRERAERVLEGAPGPRVCVRGRELWNFASNSYLGLSTHPRVVAALVAEAERTGASSTASRQVAGNLAAHQQLETALAELKRQEEALLFSSGYAANLGVLGALGRALDVASGEHDAAPPLFVSDALNHASIIDGCRLSGAEVAIYPHGNAAAAYLLLARARVEGRRALLVTESRFSMDGDVAPLAALAQACRTHGAALVVDEAHATGVDGEGRGIVHELGLAAKVDVVVGTLGKALGAHGAYAAGARATMRYLENAARPFVYSTGLPAHLAAAALAALVVLREERPDRTLVAKVRALRALLAERALEDVVGRGADGPILPVRVGDPARAMTLARHLGEHEVLAVAIRPPTVPEGGARVRLSVRADHPHEALVALADALASARAAGLVPQRGSS